MYCFMHIIFVLSIFRSSHYPILHHIMCYCKYAILCIVSNTIDIIRFCSITEIDNTIVSYEPKPEAT